MIFQINLERVDYSISSNEVSGKLLRNKSRLYLTSYIKYYQME